METTVRLRSRGSQVLAVAMIVAGAIGLLSAALDGVDALLDFGAPMILVGLLGWAAFWQPHVEVSDGGVTVVNTLRTVHVPWPAIEDVEGRYGLRLQTAYGAVTAWAASAPTGRARARGEQSEAANLVKDHLAELSAAGYLDDPRLEGPALPTTWHWVLIAAIGVLLVASVVLPQLT